MIPAVAAEQLVRLGIVAMCNVTVSNVRGPDVPLYMAGAQLELFLAVSIAFDGIGLNVTGFSYNGTLWVCFVACRDMLPDPEEFCDCLKESFAELLAAAIARGRRSVKVEARRTVADKPEPSAARRPRAVGKTVVDATASAAPRARKKPASTEASADEGRIAPPVKRTRVSKAAITSEE